ncbi:phospholipase C, phosphocholine-specific [Nocardioides sp. CCNWLW239]|uniref:phosphocholine-specific phospholipase C n=1 Tax=Nocardioides sp. CCNWLW239 TaxID=3128902 RepID=UPI00301B440B
MTDSPHMNDAPRTPATASRRQVLRGAGIAAGAAVAGSLLPPSVHRALAAAPRRGGLEAIEHVILLMQENRSFDHYFGTMKGVRGYGDPNPLRRRAGETVLHQAGAEGDVLPFSLREAAAAAGRAAGDIQYLSDLPHGFGDATAAWSDGWCDRWVPAKGRGSMTYYDRADIPLQYELADTFTIMDAYHCSVNGSTNPNRNYFWTGTTGFEADGRRAVTNAAYSYAHPGYDWTTYPERLEAAGVSWQIYQEWDNFTDNAVEYFKPFKAIGTKMLAHVEGTYRTTEEFYDSLHGKTPAEQDRLLEQLEKGRASLSAAERSLFDKAMYRSRPGTLIERVKADIAAGTLPQVVWLVPTAALSEHPGSSTPVGSANLIYDLLDVVASDLDTWSKTATLINFDENDGYFDHVPPPVAPRPPSGSGDDWYNGQPIGFGPRVPMTIVSPWTVGGVVDSSVADHTSTLRLLERITGVREPNISEWRRSVASDLTSVFDFDRSRRPEPLTQPGPVPAPIQRWQPVPPAVQKLPEQEPGRKPARPTAYDSQVTVALRKAGLTVSVSNEGSRGAAYQVYPFGGELTRPELLWVRSQASGEARLPVVDAYDVTVQGPDRYWHEATGSRLGAAAGISVGHRAARQGLELRFANSGDRAVLLAVEGPDGKPRTVRVSAGGSATLGWPTDRGWYDVQVTAPDDTTFRRHITGRIPTGSPVTA